MAERYSFEKAEDEAGQVQEGFRRAGVAHPSSEIYEKASRIETELDARAEQEAKERPERIQKLMARVDALFPGQGLHSLREEIRASFDVPQFGAYHNEGSFMDTHLDLMRTRIKEMSDGIFDEAVPEDVRTLFARLVREDPEFFEKYVFLHDIRKKDCLTITYLDGKKGSGTWQNWKDTIPAEALADPRALRAYGKSASMRGISYFQDRGKNGGFVQHGADAERYLKNFRGLEVSRGMLIAIREHEVAYQFQNIQPGTYRKHFEHLSSRERDLALAATYIDSSSALGKRRPPRADLTGFRALVDSKYNFELLQRIWGALSRRPDVNDVLLERELMRLEKRKERIADPPDDLISRVAHECRR